MEKLRLFIAIDLPDSVKQQLAKIIGQLRKEAPSIRWEKPEKIHLTFSFLGYVANPKVAAIEETIKESIVGIAPFAFSFSNLGFFWRNGRLVVWLGVVKDRTLLRLKKNLDRQMQKRGFKIEKRSFSPHLTLGRKKEAGTMRYWQTIIAAWNKKIEPIKPFFVEKIVLMQSTLTSQGSIYNLIRQFTLSE